MFKKIYKKTFISLDEIIDFIKNDVYILNIEVDFDVDKSIKICYYMYVLMDKKEYKLIFFKSEDTNKIYMEDVLEIDNEN